MLLKLQSNKKYEQAIRKTIAFVQRELMESEGGFYSALDADSEGVEGKFYVWDKIEIETILKDDAKIFCDFYDVTDNGNWEEKNILRILKSVKNFAADNNITESKLEIILNSCLGKIINPKK